VRPRRALSPDRGLLRRNVVLLLYGAPSATGVTSAGRSHCGAVKSSESPPELSVFAHFRTRPTASNSLDKPTSLADGPGCPWPRRGLGGRPTLDGLGDSSTAVSGVLERRWKKAIRDTVIADVTLVLGWAALDHEHSQGHAFLSQGG
jgi:hypothetical protein